MSARHTANRMLLLVVLAFSGFMLIYIPKLVLDQYETISKLGPTWTYVYFGIVGTGAALLLGCTIWILITLWRRSARKRRRRIERARNPSEMTLEQRDEEIRENLSTVEEYQTGEGLSGDLRERLEPLVRRVMDKRESQRLEIVAFGTVSSGKSSLLNALAGRDALRTDAKGGTTTQRNEIPWPGDDQVTLVDTPGLGEIDGEAHVAEATRAARDADLVLLVVDGPLRESEFSLLARLADMEKRIVVCLNKADWYDQRERDRLLGQIRGQVHEFVTSDDVVAVRAEPVDRTRIRLTADGQEIEETVAAPADIRALADRMLSVVRRDGRDLLMANLLLQSRGLVEDARREDGESLDRRAREIVDRYMWSAGGAAALSPLPLLDLAAGGAITTKMVLDLAKVYRQEVDVNTVVQLLAQLGKNLIAILGVSAATPAITTAIATMLKTIPGAGTIAGGVLQGTVQALVTRWIGAVFMEYFRNEMQQPEGGLSGLARREWDRVTSVAELRKLVRSARDHFGRRQESEVSP
ncbi:MAG: GTP-binding protein [Planctomycetales bacterium]|nr:GTP-binding protein [Planctomycetales bacterium]